MKALQTHAQMLEPSLGFFENEWSVLLQFLLGQGYFRYGLMDFL